MNEKSSENEDLNLDITPNELTSSKNNKNDFKNKLIPKRNQNYVEFTTKDSILMIIITALSIYSRCFRIQQPRDCMNIEIPSGNKTNLYLHGKYFAASDAPLGDMIFAAFAKLEGYGHDFDFDSIEGKQFGAMSYVSLRMINAIFCSLCAPISYLVGKYMGLSRYSSFIISFLMMCDTLMIGQSRILRSDGILYCFVSIALLSIYYHDYVETVASFIVECVCVSLALCCGYSATGIVVFAIFKQIALNDEKKYMRIRICIMLLMIFVGQYMTYATHLNALPFLPDEAAKVNVPEVINKSLVSFFSPDWETKLAAPPMWKRVLAVVSRIPRERRVPGRYTNYSTSWYTWPLFTSKWVLLWKGGNMAAVSIGNIFLMIPVFLGVLCNVGRKIFGASDKESDEMTFAYFVSLLSFAFCPGDTFIYNYVIPLMFGVFGLVLCLERYVEPWKRGFLLSSSAGISFFGVVFFSVIVFAFETDDYDFVVLNKHWQLKQL